MSVMTPGTALRNLQQAQASLKKIRQLLRLARESSGDVDPARILKAGWDGLAKAHRMIAEIPVEAATEDVMTRQLAVQRYATALLVRLRRLARNDPGALDGEDEIDEE
jgi:hypothetical protein